MVGLSKFRLRIGGWWACEKNGKILIGLAKVQFASMTCLVRFYFREFQITLTTPIIGIFSHEISHIGPMHSHRYRYITQLVAVMYVHMLLDAIPINVWSLRIFRQFVLLAEEEHAQDFVVLMPLVLCHHLKF